MLCELGFSLPRRCQWFKQIHQQPKDQLAAMLRGEPVTPISSRHALIVESGVRPRQEKKRRKTHRPSPNLSSANERAYSLLVTLWGESMNPVSSNHAGVVAFIAHVSAWYHGLPVDGQRRRPLRPTAAELDAAFDGEAPIVDALWPLLPTLWDRDGLGEIAGEGARSLLAFQARELEKIPGLLEELVKRALPGLDTDGQEAVVGKLGKWLSGNRDAFAGLSEIAAADVISAIADRVKSHARDALPKRETVSIPQGGQVEAGAAPKRVQEVVVRSRRTARRYKQKGAASFAEGVGDAANARAHRNPEGLTLAELARLVGRRPRTVSKVVAELAKSHELPPKRRGGYILDSEWQDRVRAALALTPSKRYRLRVVAERQGVLVEDIQAWLEKIGRKDDEYLTTEDMDRFVEFAEQAQT